MSQLKQTICLNMIVRNEAPVIERCLESVKRFVDHWVIVDTGSTDGTQHLIRQCMRGLPGELIERPWVNFAHNRSEALTCARGKSDYVFVIDADELLVQDRDFTLPALIHDSYYLKISSAPVTFWRIQLFRNMPGWRYESAVHEYLVGPETATYERLHGLWIDSRSDGWRAAQPDVYKQDVEQLLRAHNESPTDSRTIFHLAQSYAAAGEPESALKYYRQCVEVGRWPEEVWICLFQIAEIKQQLQREWPEVLDAYLEAYQYRPSRAEPLYRIAVHYRWSGAFHLAHMFLQQAVAIPYPQDDYLFVEERLYRYIIKMALATCCYQVGQFEAGIRYCDELLQDRGSIPPNIYEQIFVNRQQCAAKAQEVYAESAAQRPKVKVLIGVRDSGPDLDNCVERLLSQTCVPLEMVFLDLGFTGGSDEKIPIEDPRVTLAPPREAESFWSLVARQCEADDVVLLINGSDWLTSAEALAQLQNFFADPGCLVTYGQFQYADGSRGLARALPNLDSERALIEDWRCTYPLAFRGRLLQQIIDDDPALLEIPNENTHSRGFTAEEHVTLAQKIFAAAGASGIRFNSQPLCVHDPATTSRSHAPAISQPALPKISCLTVTLNRLVLLKEAIGCYCRQTYPNRELIIVTDGTPRYRRAIEDYLCRLGRNDIRLVYLGEPGNSLAALRNASVDIAEGDVVCQWDDDDLNHPQRLALQFEHLASAKADACCFTDQLQFFFHERSLYWTDWRLAVHQDIPRLIPGTLMAHRQTRFRYPENSPNASAGEDSVLLARFLESGTVTPFEDAGFLNIYSYHGANVFSELHHRRITMQASRPLDFLRGQESRLRSVLRDYRLPEPYRFTSGDGHVVFIQNGN
jgi:glycosyltransferase involved in cell wall biosynthesis